MRFLGPTDWLDLTAWNVCQMTRGNYEIRSRLSGRSTANVCLCIVIGLSKVLLNFWRVFTYYNNGHIKDRRTVVRVLMKHFSNLWRDHQTRYYLASRSKR